MPEEMKLYENKTVFPCKYCGAKLHQDVGDNHNCDKEKLVKLEDNVQRLQNDNRKIKQAIRRGTGLIV